MNAGAGDIFFYFAGNGAGLEDITFELCGAGRRLADQKHAALIGVCFGEVTDEILDSLGVHGADKIYFINHASLAHKAPEICVESLLQLFSQTQPNTILFPGSLVANDFAARLATRICAAVFTDCTDLRFDEDGQLRVTKLTHGGKIATTMVPSAPAPHIASVLPGIFRPPKPHFNRRARRLSFDPQIAKTRCRLKFDGMAKAGPDEIDLDEAQIVLAGGRGMGTAENFDLLKKMAEKLGGVVAGSLGAVDENMVPRRMLVGQTGTSVAPRLYVACGISGSIYHVLGIREAKAVVAINTDRLAPIFKYADLGILGDVREVLPAIVRTIAQEFENQANSSAGEDHGGEI
jgi:electron transfer flavoprotein alpha subunit